MSSPDPPLPQLRPDVQVRHVVQDGVTVVHLQAPNGAIKQLSQRVFAALSTLSRHDSFDAWLAELRSTEPTVSPAQLRKLLEGLQAAGLLTQPTNVPAAVPAPVSTSVPSVQVRPEAVRDSDPRIAALQSAAHTDAPVDVTAPLDPVLRALLAEEAAPSKLRSAIQSGAPPPATGRPKARTDLKVKRGPSPGLMTVKNPASGKSFQIYELEVTLLRQLDGTRTSEELLERFAGMGHSISPSQLTSFIREMVGYGFLDDTGGLEQGTNVPGTPLKGGVVEKEIPQSAWGEEERRLFQGGLGLFRQGHLDQAEGYFLALLETNPQNSEAMSMLQIVREARVGRGPMTSGEGVPIVDLSEELAAEDDGNDGAGAEGDDAEAEHAADPDGVEASDGEANLAQWEDAEREVKQDPAAKKRRWANRLKSAGKKLLVPVALMGLAFVIRIPLSITYPCVVKPMDHAIVRASRDGIIAEILVTEGQLVAAGDVVARMESGDLQTEVLQSRAALDKARAELELLQQGSRAEEVDRVRARVNGLYREVGLAQRRLQRVRGLVRKGVAPRDDLDRAQADLASLRSQASQAQADLKLTSAGSRTEDVRKKEAELKSIEAQLALDEARLEAAVLSAPMQGNVTTRRPGELQNARVAAGDSVIEIAQFNPMRAEVLVGERDFDVLKKGLPIQLRVAAHPTTKFRGEVLRIAQQVEVVDGENVIRVEGSIQNDEGLLVPNMTGYAEIEAEETSLAWLVFRRVLRWVRVRFLI